MAIRMKWSPIVGHSLERHYIGALSRQNGLWGWRTTHCCTKQPRSHITTQRLFSTTSRQRAAKLTAETYPKLKRSPAFKTLDDADVSFFRSVVGDSGVVTDADDLAGYNTDWMGKYCGQSQVVVRPGSTDEVSRVLAYCNSKKLAVVPQGGNTGLVGGSVPVFDEVILSLSRMNRVLNFDAVSGVVTVEAGAILEVVDKYLAERGHIFPLDLGAKGSCQIGGNLSTNAGGLRLLRYGSLHGNVLGIEAVLPDGRIFRDPCRLRKDNTGLDLKQLFVGAEGTLGVITAATIQCAQRPAAVNVAYLGLSGFDKVRETFREAKAQLSEILSAFELMDFKSQDLVRHVTGNKHPLDSGDHPFYCLIETSGSNAEHDAAKLEAFLEDVMGRGLVDDGVLAQDATQAASLWAWREGIPEASGHFGGVYKYDVSIPLADLYSLVEDTRKRLDEAGLVGDSDDHAVVAAVGYGHMGDSNLHLNVACRRYDPAVEQVLEPWVYEWIGRRNGSISAEHGIGIAKAQYLGLMGKDPMVDMMRQIKRLYDPVSTLR